MTTKQKPIKPQLMWHNVTKSEYACVSRDLFLTEKESTIQQCLVINLSLESVEALVDKAFVAMCETGYTEHMRGVQAIFAAIGIKARRARR